MLLLVFFASLVSALCTGLGVIPFFFMKSLPRPFLGVSNALASGIMFSASCQLLFEALSFVPRLAGDALLAPGTHASIAAGVDVDLAMMTPPNLVPDPPPAYLFLSPHAHELRWMPVLISSTIGVLFMWCCRYFLSEPNWLNIVKGDRSEVGKVLLIVGVMTAHSLAEGIGIGTSFAGGEGLAFAVSTALAVHNIPEGLAIALVLVPRDYSPQRAMWVSILSSMPQPIMAPIAYMFVEFFSTLLPHGLSFAAAAMLWIVFTELLPDACATSHWTTVVVVSSLSALAMFVFQATVLDHD